MKKILALLIIFSLASCAELQQISERVNEDILITNPEIATGLRQALQQGINEEVTKLTQQNGFYENELVKIHLPAELKEVEETMREIGLDNLTDEGIKVLNRAAEDAVKEATPIFIDAVKNMSFADAKNILLGNDTAATTYLQQQTTDVLYIKFHPQIKNSLSKVGAFQVWEKIIERYNMLPLRQDVNPDLADYVTRQAMKGVFTMIAQEEQEIRNNITARTTPLLQRIFALQDEK